MSLEFSPNWFLLIFNLGGGIAIGVFLRRLLRGQFACNTFFLLIWGALFGGIPLFINEGLMKGTPGFFALQLFVFGAALLVTAFVPEILLEPFQTPAVTTIAVGGIFALFGIAALASILFDATEVLQKSMLGGFFVLAGGSMFLRGIKTLTKDE